MRNPIACLLLAAAAASTGCGTLHTDNTMRLTLEPPQPAPEPTGIRIGDETLKQFRAGETRETWVLAILGQPTSQDEVMGETDTHILRYSTVESTSGIGAVLSGQSTRSSSTVFFVVKDGIIQKFWADRDTERTLLGREVEKKSGEKQAR